MASPTTIDQLNDISTNWIIHAKVVAFWLSNLSTYGFIKKEMILCDEEGNKIEATIPPFTFGLHIPHEILEGAWYILCNFKVIRQNREFRNTNHSFRIKFWEQTRMLPMPTPTFHNFFVFKDFSDIKNNRVSKEFPIDVYGVLIDFSEVKLDHGLPLLTFTLLDPKNETLSCRSYREDANDIREYWIENGYDKMIKEDPVFVVLSFWRIAECEGDICLTNNYGCAKISMNPLYTSLANHKILCEFAGRQYLDNVVKKDIQVKHPHRSLKGRMCENPFYLPMDLTCIFI